MPTISLPEAPLHPMSTRDTTLLRRLTSGLVVVLLAVGGSTLAVPSAQADSGDGTALGWGSSPAVPASLGGKDVIGISSLDGHNVALTSDGLVTAWGANDFGQTDVPASLTDVTAVGAGCSHTLALTSDGHLTAWGDNSAGQRTVPPSLADKTVTDISVGCGHNMALTSDGQITAWGGNTDGQTTLPPSLSGKTVTAIDAAWGHSMAVTSDGVAHAWGRNSEGQVNIPASLTGRTVTDVAGGFFHSVALTSDGQVTAWGDNSTNQRAVPNMSGKIVIDIEASVWHSLALTSDGKVFAWGHNGQCQLCVPGLPAGTGYTAISVGHLHSVGVRAPLPIDFTTGTTAEIAGSTQVGQTLTALDGDVSPAATSHRYRWFADGAAISGATGSDLVLTSAQQDAMMTVQVTSLRHGYNDSTNTSESAGPVAGVTVTGTTTVGRTLRGNSSVSPCTAQSR